MAEIMGGGFMGGRKKSRQRPDVNIVEEYRLIQNKKSRLSKSERDWVVYEFESTFTKVV